MFTDNKKNILNFLNTNAFKNNMEILKNDPDPKKKEIMIDMYKQAMQFGNDDDDIPIPKNPPMLKRSDYIYFPDDDEIECNIYPDVPVSSPIPVSPISVSSPIPVSSEKKLFPNDCFRVVKL